ncbi:hypothetical protein D3C73_985310 [compost metagenome]
MCFRKTKCSLESVARIVKFDFFSFTAVDILNHEHSVHIPIQLIIWKLLPVARQKRSDFHIISALVVFRCNRVHLKLEIVVKNKIYVDLVLGRPFDPQLPISLRWS